MNYAKHMTYHNLRTRKQNSKQRVVLYVSGGIEMNPWLKNGWKHEWNCHAFKESNNIHRTTKQLL